MQRSDDASDDALSFVILKKAILQKSEASDNQIIWWSVTFIFHIYKDQIMLYKFVILQKSGQAVIRWSDLMMCIFQFWKDQMMLYNLQSLKKQLCKNQWQVIIKGSEDL